MSADKTIDVSKLLVGRERFLTAAGGSLAAAAVGSTAVTDNAPRSIPDAVNRRLGVAPGVAAGLIWVWTFAIVDGAWAQDAVQLVAQADKQSVATPSTPRPRHRIARPAKGRKQKDARGSLGADDSHKFDLKLKAAATATPAPPLGVFDPGYGLAYRLNYLSETAGNPFGGLRQGVDYADQILFGVDADLNKLAGIQGGTIHVIATQRDGRNLAQDYIGNSLAPQEIFDGSENTRLTVLTYEQKFLNDRLDIEVGRRPAEIAFLGSPLYCDFQNVGTCGAPEIAFADTNLTFFPTSTYGGRVKYFFDDKIFLHVGAFEVQPATVLASDHGLDFTTNGATGVVIPIELGYTTTAANDPFPRNYSIGAIIDQSRYADPVRDIAGGAALLSGLPAQTDFGRSLVYGRFDQTVWHPDGDPSRTLQLFGVAAFGTSGRETQQYQLEAGVVLTGPFANRPFDTAGFVVSDQKFSALGLANIQLARASLGLSNTKVASSETLFELNYAIQLSPAVRFTPNLQYIVNPDEINEPFLGRPIPNAFVVGARLAVDLFTLAGVAKGPGSR